MIYAKIFHWLLSKPKMGDYFKVPDSKTQLVSVKA